MRIICIAICRWLGHKGIPKSTLLEIVCFRLSKMNCIHACTCELACWPDTLHEQVLWRYELHETYGIIFAMSVTSLSSGDDTLAYKHKYKCKCLYSTTASALMWVWQPHLLPLTRILKTRGLWLSWFTSVPFLLLQTYPLVPSGPRQLFLSQPSLHPCCSFDEAECNNQEWQWQPIRRA